MVSTLAFNPMATTNAAGTFGISWDGLIQGTVYADPAARYALAGGILASTETLPMWGGIAISENVASATSPYYGSSTLNPLNALGNTIIRATNTTDALAPDFRGSAGAITGWSAFDQNYSNISNAQSPVPQSLSGMLVNFYRLGSGARIALAMAPALSSIPGTIISSAISWDFVNQQLIPGVAAYAATNQVSGTYTSSTGIIAITFGSAPMGTTAPVGAYGTLSGLAGTGNGAQLNGTWAVTGSASSGTIISFQGPIGLGAITITGSTGQLNAGGGYLPIRVLDTSIGNSMTVSYNSTTGYTTWNRSGSAAVCLI